MYAMGLYVSFMYLCVRLSTYLCVHTHVRLHLTYFPLWSFLPSYRFLNLPTSWSRGS
ncbi:hypothetical protein B484DRAFT_447181 [Ochromonadaceae sp. CCMP2298]|nr:hypothetical protein B484DRAFT_447181 [Ochromonadaceae sp. CCMP2298]